MNLRDLVEDDFADVLALNAAEVPHVNAIDAATLRDLLGWSERALVAEVDGRIAGFTLTIGPDVPYASLNYAWFTRHHPGVHYLDRVVVAPDFRRTGVASALYARIEERRPVGLEVNVEPRNEISLAFHAARGFVEVGRLDHPGGHVVALMLKR